MTLQATGSRSTFGESMVADRSRSSLSGLDRFISSASRADDRNKELTVVPSGRGQLAQVYQSNAT
jgi:hypothetical protein